MSGSRVLRQEVTFVVQDCKPVGPDRMSVVFDDERVVSDAGLVLCATTAQRLDLPGLLAAHLRLGRGRPGAGNESRKALSVVMGMLAGADCIDDLDLLRAGRTGRVLGLEPAAPSTLGTFLRGFSFGHVRQLDAVLDRSLQAAWKAGAGPQGRLVIDVDSFVREVYGTKKHGASYTYTHVLGYHPFLAVRADTGEVLHLRLREGAANSQRGISRHLDELIARVGRAAPDAPVLLRADSGFHNEASFKKLDRCGWQFSVAIRATQPIRRAIDAIPDSAWTTIEDYPDSGLAQVAETTVAGRRVIVRRVRTENHGRQLFDTWRHFPIATNRTEALQTVEAEHRDHAVIEQTIADLKAQALAHLPSGNFHANGAWAALAVLAHNLHRWTLLLGAPDEPVRRHRTTHRRLLAIPGRLTTHARGWTLHLPARWPWASDFQAALNRLRALPPPA